MLRKIIGITALVLLAGSTVAARSFFVAPYPYGDDSLSGNTIDSAWARIDRGDLSGEVRGGDTVNILPGDYSPLESVELNQSGSPDSIIVYRRYGVGKVTVNVGAPGASAIIVNGRNTELHGISVEVANSHGIEVNGDSCLVNECFVRDVTRNGFLISGWHCLVLRSAAVHCEASGIRIDGAQYCNVYNNTVFGNTNYGIELTSTVRFSEVYNNIVAYSGSHGITGPDENVCGYNLVWENGGNDYNGSIYNLEGGLATDPGFVSGDENLFNLVDTSAAIDAGKDLGYGFTGSAPDMGAYEKYNRYFVSPDGNEHRDGRTVENAFGRIDEADVVVQPGDTVFVFPGTYSAPVNITSSGRPNDYISFVGVRDSCLIDASGFMWGLALQGEYINWVGIDVKNSAQDNVALGPPHNRISYCRIIGANRFGVYAHDSCSFINNTIAFNQSAGIVALADSHLAIHNTFVANGQADLVLYGYNNFVANNIFVAATEYTLAVIISGPVFYSMFDGYLTPFGEHAIPAEGCQYTDPMLTDPEADDFHLRVESPAIDFGVDLGQPFCGEGPDLGAYETGNPDSITIVVTSDTLRADSTYPFEVLAFDSAGHPTRPGTVAWDHTFGTGSISSEGVFTPSQIGTGLISAFVPLYDLYCQTDLLTVVTGSLYELQIDPNRATLLVDSTRQFSADGRDSRGNLILDTGPLSWSVLNDIGQIDDNGNFTAVNPGYGFVRVTAGDDVQGFTDTITVLPEIAHVDLVSLTIPSGELVPGQFSGPLLVLDVTNNSIVDFALDSLRIRFAGIDPEGASQAQLDSQIDNVYLYRDKDNDHTTLGPEDELVAEGSLSDGTIVLPTPGISVPAGSGNIQLSVAADLNQQTPKNGNSIAFELTAATDIYSDQETPVEADFPVTSPDVFTVNTFPIANVMTNDVEPAILFQGQTNQIVLDFELPSNGYAEDRLSSLILVNGGTFVANGENLGLKLWVDAVGEGRLDDAVLLGSFEYSSYWQLSDLNQVLEIGTTRFLVTADIIGDQFEGGTLKLQVPTGGVEYFSGTDGPDDGVISNAASFLIMPSDRVTAISIPTETETVLPGSQGNAVLTFALYNGYSSSQVLQSVRFTNSTRTASTADFADAELGQVTLFFDDNLNRVLDDDLLVASGVFSDGSLRLFAGDLALPPRTLSYFFVAADLPELDVIDSDSLSVTIEEESDITFASTGETVNINGDLPLTGGGFLIIDGSVGTQYQLLPLTSATVAAGDTSVTLLTLRPAVNGDQPDVLNSISLVNIGTATSNDFDLLELWLDVNGDDLWQSDDSLVTTFTIDGAGWLAQLLDIDIASSAPTLFVTGDVSATAAPDVSFQAQIPMDGCQYESGNDGPIDAALTGPAEFIISNSGLRLSTLPLKATYSVGQEIQIKATVTNAHLTALDTVFCQFAAADDPDDSVIVGPVALAPAESHEFALAVLPTEPGEVAWQVRSFSRSPGDSSASLTTDVVQIQQVPTDVVVEFTNSIPTAVSRGQANVFPLSISFSHAQALPELSWLRLDSVCLHVEDGNGQPLAASDVFSRMVVATEYVNLATVNTLPEEPAVWLLFAQPVVVPPGEEQLLSILVDIAPDASASEFALNLQSGSDIDVVDHNTLQTVSLDPDLVFPMKTASCRIDDPSQQLAVSGVSVLNATVNYDQDNVDALRVTLRHPGSAGSSQVQLTSLAFEFLDDALVPVDADGLVTGMSVMKQQVIIGELSTIPGQTAEVTVDFNAPPTLSPGETLDLILRLQICPQPSHGGFAVCIADSTALTVRDLSSGSLVTAVSDQVLSTGNVFPIRSGVAEFKYPAVAPDICMSSLAPASAVGGTEGVELLECNIAYPVSGSYSSLLARQLVVSMYDSTGVPFNPNELFDRIGVSVDDGPISYEPFIELEGGYTVFHFDSDGLMIGPGDVISVRLLGDIENATPIDNFVVTVTDTDALTVRDATDTTSGPGATIAADCDTGLPLTSQTTVVFLPAGRPTLAASHPPTQICFPGQSSLPILNLDFSYDSPTLQGDLEFSGLRATAVERTAGGQTPVNAGTVFSAVYLTIDGDTLACDSLLADNTIVLNPDSSYTVSRGDVHEISLVCDLQASAPTGNFLIALSDSTFCDINDKNLLTTIYPIITGGNYPLLSAEISLCAAGLANSLTSFPNPFNPDAGEVATVGYVLTRDAHIDIELFTVTGQLVKRVALGALREAGSHREDYWDGLNERGMNVLPGTYFCRIHAEYLDGGSETFKRKITVVR